jgi:hypothetical protein
MKCVQNIEFGIGNGEVVRMDDYKAKNLVETGSYIYCSKELWKALGRKYK